MKQFLINLILSAIAVFALAALLSGVSIENFLTAVVVALVLAFLNAIVKPILIVLTIPVTVITLGLFLLVMINVPIAVALGAAAVLLVDLLHPLLQPQLLLFQALQQDLVLVGIALHFHDSRIEGAMARLHRPEHELACVGAGVHRRESGVVNRLGVGGRFSAVRRYGVVVALRAIAEDNFVQRPAGLFPLVNQMLDLPLVASDRRIHVSDLIHRVDLAGRGIVTGEHCYGCTAGQGSSCGGALEE